MINIEQHNEQNGTLMNTDTVDEKRTLRELKNRADGIKDNIVNIENELISLEIDATNNVELVNEKCDRVIEIIENYRNSLLRDIEKLKNDKKHELEKQLKSFKIIDNITSETNRKCHEYAANIDNVRPYRLIGLNKMINDGYQKEKQLNITTIATITKSYIDIDFKKLLEASINDLNIEMEFGNNIILNDEYNNINNNSIIAKIPLYIKHQIVIENWFRIYCNKQSLQSLPKDVNDLIDRYSSSKLGDKFDSSINYETITIENDGKIVKKSCDSRSESVFGSIIATNGCLYKWQIKINKIDTMNIGIIESEKCDKYLNKSWWLTNIGYSYYNANGYFYHADDATFGGTKYYGTSYHENDIISINLDLREYKVSFGKNGVCFSYQNIKNTDYRLAIGMSGKMQQCVQLLSSTIN